MALPQLTAMPGSITAGTTVTYTVTYADFPASDGWAAKLYVAGRNVVTPVAGVASGASFTYTLTPAITAELGAGVYQWREVATKAGATYVAASGTVIVEQDVTVAIAGTAQPIEERMLELVEAALAGRLTADQQAYSIGGRAVTKIPVMELFAIRDACKAKLAAMRTGSAFRSVPVTFVPPEAS